jgi:hypothetical protein
VHGKATPKMEIGVRINGELPSVLIIVLLKRDLPLYSGFDEKAALNCVLLSVRLNCALSSIKRFKL